MKNKLSVSEKFGLFLKKMNLIPGSGIIKFPPMRKIENYSHEGKVKSLGKKKAAPHYHKK